MTGSKSYTPTKRKALLFGLEEALASSLQEVLSRCGCRARLAGSDESPRPADIVFCASTPDLRRAALNRFHGLPVVVVSRLPEVEGWLDALEDGAADYCAAPFEPVQLKWLLDTHTRQRKAFAAA